MPDDETVSSMDTLKVLGRFMRHLSAGTMAPTRVLEEVVRTASQHLGFGRSAFLAVRDDGFIRGVTSWGLPPTMIQYVAEPRHNMGLLNDAIRYGETSHSYDVRADGSLPDHIIQLFGLSSLVTAPLLVEGRLVGLLCVDNAGQNFELTENDRVFIDAFAGQAALALRMSRLVAEGVQAALKQERMHVARRLHDTAAQMFYVIGAECARTKSAPRSTIDREMIQRIEGLAARGGQEIRRAIDLTRVPECTVKFPGHLRDVLDELRDLYGCHVVATGDWHSLQVDATLWENLLSVVREAVTNAVKHGEARNVVTWVRQSGATVVLEVRDDGAGGSGGRGAATSGTGFGLSDLRRRLAPWGGQLDLHPNDDGGHTLHVKLLTPR
jgi:signal transduction histidine kinase